MLYLDLNIPRFISIEDFGYSVYDKNSKRSWTINVDPIHRVIINLRDITSDTFQIFSSMIYPPHIINRKTSKIQSYISHTPHMLLEPELVALHK